MFCNVFGQDVALESCWPDIPTWKDCDEQRCRAANEGNARSDHVAFVHSLRIWRTGESHRPLTPILWKVSRYTSFLSRCFCKSMPFSWQKVVYPGRNYIHPPPPRISGPKPFFRGGGWGCIFWGPTREEFYYAPPPPFIHPPPLEGYFQGWGTHKIWQKVVHAPPVCITIRLPFVSRCFCGSIRVRGRWNTPAHLKERCQWESLEASVRKPRSQSGGLVKCQWSCRPRIARQLKWLKQCYMT